MIATQHGLHRMTTPRAPAESLTPSQMQALEKSVAFIRRAMSVTRSDHITISEMIISPGRVHGRVQVQIRIDDETNSA